MTGYEEQLHARAELLEDTGELAAAVTLILTGASGAGVDPDAITGLRAAATALDPAGAPPGYQAGDPADRRPGTGYRSDSDFLEAISDTDDQTGDWLGQVRQLTGQVTAAAEQAHADLNHARRDLDDARQALAAAYAMPTKTNCDGCHGRKQRAITAAEAAITNAEHRIGDDTRRIGICDDTADLLDPLTRRLQAALRALRQVPHDLGEVYELIYQFIRCGGQMPRYGRWIEGTPATG